MTPSSSSGVSMAYGGLVINSQGQVLLREPRNHFDGYVWTFPKGRPEPGETPEQAALREVEEETGVRAVILLPIPGEFPGGTTLNRYFLMSPIEPISPLPADCPETISVRWADFDEAQELIQMTQNSIGKARDLAVLEAATHCWGEGTPFRLKESRGRD